MWYEISKMIIHFLRILYRVSYSKVVREINSKMKIRFVQNRIWIVQNRDTISLNAKKFQWFLEIYLSNSITKIKNRDQMEISAEQIQTAVISSYYENYPLRLKKITGILSSEFSIELRNETTWISIVML